MDYDHRKWPGVILRPLKRHHLKPFAAGLQCAKKANRRRSLLDKGGKCCRKCWSNPTERKYRDPDWDWGRCDKAPSLLLTCILVPCNPSPFPHFRVLDFRLEASHQPKKSQALRITTPREPLFFHPSTPPSSPSSLRIPHVDQTCCLQVSFVVDPVLTQHTNYMDAALDQAGLILALILQFVPGHVSSMGLPSRDQAVGSMVWLS